MKYQIAIPRPSAKRLKHRKVIIELSSGWQAFPSKIYPIDVDQCSFEFEVGDEFEYAYSTSMNDGFIFDVMVESTNDNGSRKEVIKLVPLATK